MSRESSILLSSSEISLSSILAAVNLSSSSPVSAETSVIPPSSSSHDNIISRTFSEFSPVKIIQAFPAALAILSTFCIILYSRSSSSYSRVCNSSSLSSSTRSFNIINLSRFSIRFFFISPIFFAIDCRRLKLSL